MAKEQDWSAEQQQSLVDAYRSVIEEQIAAEKAPMAMLMQPPSSL
jgi:hypothetical protein